MLITKQFVIDNSEQIFSNKDLIELMINKFNGRNSSTRWGIVDELKTTVYSIIISRGIKRFIRKYPWIKCINLYKLVRLINIDYKIIYITTYYNHELSRITKFNMYEKDIDLQINIIFRIFQELDIYVKDWMSLHKHVKSVMLLHFDLDNILEDIITKSFKDPNLNVFSTNPNDKETHSDEKYFNDRQKLLKINRLYNRRLEEHEELAQTISRYISTISDISMMTTTSGDSMTTTTVDIDSSNYNDTHNVDSHTIYNSDNSPTTNEYIRFNYDGTTFHSTRR